MSSQGVAARTSWIARSEISAAVQRNQKVSQIDDEKLRSSNGRGIELIVKAVGGSLELSQAESRIDVYEKALYSVTQKSDETHDSYVARHDVQFEELKATGAGFEDIRSFILLRNSGLAAEGRKRIVMECEGNLTYEKVCRSIKILGSKVFNDLQGSKTNRTKTYDIHFTENDVNEDEPYTDKAFTASSSGPTPNAWEDIEQDTDFIEAMAANEDADALTIQNFEESSKDSCRALMDAMTSYHEARQRLLQENKSRGLAGFEGNPQESWTLWQGPLQEQRPVGQVGNAATGKRSALSMDGLVACRQSPRTLAQVDGDALMANREMPESSEVHPDLPEEVMTLEKALFASQVGSVSKLGKG